ncbi:hypothetical protein SO694_00001558 [Aureococcus anophagefferens]|uniref:C3H1-type domain-containing protein n=1 Tax=Aureococcus anophagefferens TaxID=44056 RepID=A0ABR1GC12_AURAN
MPRNKQQMPMCQYGASCTRKGCVYRHPPKPAKKAVKNVEICVHFIGGACSFGDNALAALGLGDAPPPPPPRRRSRAGGQARRAQAFEVPAYVEAPQSAGGGRRAVRVPREIWVPLRNARVFEDWLATRRYAFAVAKDHNGFAGAFLVTGLPPDRRAARASAAPWRDLGPAAAAAALVFDLSESGRG